jgi:hypothetical protein
VNNRKVALELRDVVAVAAVVVSLSWVASAVAGRLQSDRASGVARIGKLAKGELLYEQDHDSMFVLAAEDVYDDGCPSTKKQDPRCIRDIKVPTRDWPLALMPYVKDVKAFVNPDTGDPQGYFSEGNPNYLPRNWNPYAQFAYNYTFLAPISIGTPVFGAQPGGGPPSIGSEACFRSAAIHPEKTVLFVSAQTFAAYNDAAKQFDPPDYDLAMPPGAFAPLYFSTKRLVLGGDPGSAENPSQYYVGWVKNSPRGEFTSNIRVLKPKPGAYTAWLDGHVSIQTDEQLAAGTDFDTSAPENKADYNNGKYLGCDITDIDKYLWSLDGTVRDLR